MNHSDLVEVSLGNLREHRTDAARWLAVEVLLSDERPSKTTPWPSGCTTSRTVSRL